MTATVDEQRWMTVRRSVEQTADRLAGIVAAARQPSAKATDRWSVVDTAVHVATVAALHSTCLRPEASTLDIPGLADRLEAATVDSVSDLNVVALAHVTEREPVAVAELLRSEVARLLDQSDGLDPHTLVDWLGGSQVPIAGLLAHVLNELSIHGRDIALATRDPWTIPPEDAAAFFDLFVVGMVRAGHGRLLDREGPPRPGQITVSFRSAYGPPATLVLRAGRVTVEEPSGPVDVRITYHPTIFNLMMFGRVSKARAVLTGKVRVAGRRPWLLPKFLETVRMPS